LGKKNTTPQDPNVKGKVKRLGLSSSRRRGRAAYLLEQKGRMSGEDLGGTLWKPSSCCLEGKEKNLVLQEREVRKKWIPDTISRLTKGKGQGTVPLKGG